MEFNRVPSGDMWAGGALIFIVVAVSLCFGYLWGAPVSDKNCETGYHEYEKWADFSNTKGFQIRYCKKCGKSQIECR